MEFKELFNKKDEYFQRILGVDKITFQKLLIILKTKINQKIILKGRPFNLDLENRLVMTLRLLYENRTYHSIGAEYNLSKSSVARNVQ
jgi:DNA-directed RNA polymerase specialized sigma subunit